MKAGRFYPIVAALALLLSACRPAPIAPPRRPAASTPILSCFSAADRILDRAVVERILPGGVLAIGGRSELRHVRPFGRLTARVDGTLTRADTLYDLASMTKAVATSTLAMVLVGQGQLDLDAPVSKWLPGFDDERRRRIRVRDLLGHSAGLREWAPLYKEVRDKGALLSRIAELDLLEEPGARSVYSDLGPIVLGEVLERVTGTSLETATRRWVFDPLGMKDTLYRPSAGLRERVAPTGESVWRGRFLQGEVHDENAYRMDGVAGHAGLFSTAPDLARVAKMLMNGGIHDSRRFVRAEMVEMFTRRVGVPGSSRTLGWETPTGDPWAGTGWSSAAYGHTGNTGTAMWIDPKRDVYVILLTNRVLMGGSGEAFLRMRRDVCDAVLKAMQQGCGTRP